MKREIPTLIYVCDLIIEGLGCHHLPKYTSLMSSFCIIHIRALFL